MQNLIWTLLLLLVFIVFIFFISYAFYLANKSDIEKQIQINEKRLYKKACLSFEKENKELKKLNEKMKNTWRKNRYKRK